MLRYALIGLAVLAATPASSKAVKIIEPLAAGIVGADQVVAVDVTVSEGARATFALLETKAAGKRTAAKLTPIDLADPQAGASAPPEEYATLPLARMLPLMIVGETREWGLTGGRALKLAIQVDTLKTADAGVAMLLGSNDQLAGIVSVADAATGEKLGEFYVDVLNTRAGLLGLAMRGSGVREKLAAEFSKHVAEVLSGRKSKTAKPVQAA